MLSVILPMLPRRAQCLLGAAGRLARKRLLCSAGPAPWIAGLRQANRAPWNATAPATEDHQQHPESESESKPGATHEGGIAGRARIENVPDGSEHRTGRGPPANTQPRPPRPRPTRCPRPPPSATGAAADWPAMMTACQSQGPLPSSLSCPMPPRSSRRRGVSTQLWCVVGCRRTSRSSTRSCRKRR